MQVQGTDGVGVGWADGRILALLSCALVTVCHPGTRGHGGLGMVEQALGGVWGGSLTPVDTTVDKFLKV